WNRTRSGPGEPLCWNAGVAVTPSGRRLVAATEGTASDGDIIAWDLSGGRKRTLVEGAEASYAAALIPPGRWLAAGGKDNNAFLVDIWTAKNIGILAHESAVLAIADS